MDTASFQLLPSIFGGRVDVAKIFDLARSNGCTAHEQVPHKNLTVRQQVLLESAEGSSGRPSTFSHLRKHLRVTILDKYPISDVNGTSASVSISCTSFKNLRSQNDCHRKALDAWKRQRLIFAS